MAVLKEILSESAIAEIVADVAAEISKDYQNIDLTVIGVLNGAFIFLSDLVRNLDLNITIDFVQLASYGAGIASSGNVELVKRPVYDFAGKNVLVVEDIVDTGLTMRFLMDYLRAGDAKSVKTCVFADKKCCRQVFFEADYVGYVAADRFLVGYGLDYNGSFRQLPGLYELFLDE